LLSDEVGVLLDDSVLAYGCLSRTLHLQLSQVNLPDGEQSEGAEEVREHPHGLEKRLLQEAEVAGELDCNSDTF